MVTLKEVAAAAGVSTVTASSVLSGINRVRVAPETANRIREIAKNMNYVPLAAARGLRTGKTNIIAFIAPTYSHHRWDDSWHEVLRGISDVMWEREERLMLGLPKSEENDLDMLRQIAFGRQVDGFILHGADAGFPGFSILKQAERPFVLIGGAGPCQGMNGVSFDMDGLGHSLARKLGSDCGALAALLPQSGPQFGIDAFRNGFLRGAGEQGLPCDFWNGSFVPNPDWLDARKRLSGGKPLGVALLRGLLPETIQALGRAGAPVGSGSRLVYMSTSDDILMPPAGLEVLRFDNYTLGRRAARLLMRLVDGKNDVPDAESTLIPATPMDAL